MMRYQLDKENIGFLRNNISYSSISLMYSFNLKHKVCAVYEIRKKIDI